MSNDNVKYSIVVPCYNCEKTIKRCIESLTNQSYQNIEVLLIDDGSTDRTLEMLYGYNKDHRIHIITHDNHGVTYSWKKGVIASRGEYVLSCDSDDYFDLDVIEKLDSIVCECEPDIIAFGALAEYSDSNIIRLNNLLEEGYYSKDDIASKVLPFFFYNKGFQSELLLKSRWSKCISRKVLMELLDDIPDNITLGEDALTIFCSVVKAQSIYCFNNFFPYHYVRNENSLTGTYKEEVFNKLSLLYQQYFALAEKYDYRYMQQIYQDYSAMLFVHMKKALDCDRSDRKRNISMVKRVVRSDDFIRCMHYCDISYYKTGPKVFAFLIMNGRVETASILLRLIRFFSAMIERK